MKKILPQEVEVWYLIPAIRKELAKVFIKEYHLKQKQVAEVLGITEAAVSQYLKSKRGQEVKFSPKEMAEIEKAAKRIAINDENSTEVLYGLCSVFRGSEFLCKIHKKLDKSVAGNCRACK